MTPATWIMVNLLRRIVYGYDPIPGTGPEPPRLTQWREGVFLLRDNGTRWRRGKKQGG